MTTRLVLLLLVFFLVLGPPAGAAAPDVLTRVQAKGWTEECARELMAAFMEDGKLQEEEQAWLRTLARAEGTVDFQGVAVPAPSGRTRELLELYSAPPNMHTLWEGDARQFQQLVDLARVNEALWARVVRFVGSRFEPVWKASNVLNGYGPTVLEVNRCYKLLQASGEPTLQFGSYLLCDGLRNVPREGKEEVPPFLYYWMIRPYEEKAAPRS